eukprot:CAMPEP_0197683470 /NCGR_PEP_ID=MMETSP1338-20131121/98003_1 /TAXON_ID=43686 ORGANISM="Pelagodinium beii, Strain RCC1491" /NCGR_SAMPLE_ID=MMETSP1338 /ASSEMBLY_ACC=CAM_ASM_000754 /LENGTH=68 /DNA_ID=CAMNT_0043265063 /DNA_START=713 /DNA_END=919 /DNA_ORIENTATION=-
MPDSRCDSLRPLPCCATQQPRMQHHVAKIETHHSTFGDHPYSLQQLASFEQLPATIEQKAPSSAQLRA